MKKEFISTTSDDGIVESDRAQHRLLAYTSESDKATLTLSITVYGYMTNVRNLCSKISCNPPYGESCADNARCLNGIHIRVIITAGSPTEPVTEGSTPWRGRTGRTGQESSRPSEPDKAPIRPACVTP